MTINKTTTSSGGLWNRKSQQQQQQQQPHLVESESPGNSETSSVGSFSMEEEEEEEYDSHTPPPDNHPSQTDNDDEDDDGLEQGRLVGSEGIVLDSSHFTYRPIQISDRDRVKQLHEEWFPVTYQDEFYKDLAEGHLAGVPVFTRIAIYNDRRRNNDNSHSSGHSECDTTLLYGFESTTTTPSAATTTSVDEETGLFGSELLTHDFDDDNDDDDNDDTDLMQPLAYDSNDKQQFWMEPNRITTSVEQSIQPPPHQEREDIIAGCVVGSFMPVTRLPPSLQNLLAPNPLRHSRLFYIMTLGTVTEYRHAGLGTRLVQHCIDLVQQDPSCGTLYLHCITFNQGAIQLYEKLGFYRVQEIPDYYDIQGQKYPCYLYAKYFHGNQGHRDIYKMIAHCVWSFLRQLMHIANIPPGLILGGNTHHSGL